MRESRKIYNCIWRRKVKECSGHLQVCEVQDVPVACTYEERRVFLKIPPLELLLDLDRGKASG